MNKDIGRKENFFDLSDVADTLIPGYKKTVSDVQSGISGATDAVKSVTPIANYISQHWLELLIGFTVMNIISGVIANYISKKL